MPLLWVLCTVLVAMTYNLFSLVVESGMLLSTRIIETVRSEEYLILSFVIRTTIRTSSSLTIATPSHNHGWLACRNARSELLSSVLLLIWRMNLIVSTSSSLIRRGLLIRIFTHDWTSNRSILVYHLLRRVLSLSIIVLWSGATIMSSMISSFSSISRICLSTLISSIKILSSTPILGHIQSVFNAWRPLPLSVPHWEMWISMSQIGLWSLVRLSLIILPILIFARRRSSSHSCGLFCTTRIFMPCCLGWSLFVENLRFLSIRLSTFTSIAGSSILALHVSVYLFVIVHLLFDARLNMLVLLSGWYHSGPHLIHGSGFVPCGTSCLWSRSARGQLRHFPPLTLSVRVRSIIHPWFLMTLTRWTVAHDNCSTFLPADNAIIHLVLLLVRVIHIFVISWLRRWPSMMLLVVLSIISSLLRDGIIVSVIFPRMYRWIGSWLLILAIQVLSILRR